jgi:methyl-accepting chemotaxis protein
MLNPKYKRRQYLVDPAYQLRFVTRIFMVVMAVAVTSSLLASALLWNNLFSPDLQRQTSIVTALIAVATTLLVELLLAIPLVFYLGIHQSHRIVGPMNRLKRTLEAIGNGDFSQRITLRKGDLLEDLAQSINQMAEHLQQRTAPPPGS